MTPIGQVKLLGLIFQRDREIYVVVDAMEPGFTTVVRVSQVLERITEKGRNQFPTHRWNDCTDVDPVVKFRGDEFQTSRKGTYLAIAQRFGITEFKTLAVPDLSHG